MIEPHIQAALLDQLEAGAHAIGAHMAEAIVRDVAPIGAVARHDPPFHQRFVSHCEQHVRVLAATTRARRIADASDLEFVREVATRRAEDAFPMAALLDGLRVGHRVLSQRIADLAASQPRAGLWLVRASIDYMDAASRVLTDGYLARQQLVLGRTELVRRQLLDDLLEGRYAGRADAADSAAAQGFEPDAQYCVAVLVPNDAGAGGAPGAGAGAGAGRGGGSEAERLAQVLAAELGRAAFNVTAFRFVVVRRDEVVAILRAADTAAVVTSALAAFERRTGTTARAGLSTSCRGVTETPRGYWEAARALRVATNADPCIDLRRLGVLRYLAASADSVAQRLAMQAVGLLVGNGSERHAVLADTILAYVDCACDASRTAERLRVHFNTVHNRLERVAGLLDRGSLTSPDLVELAVAIRICRAQPSPSPRRR